jgi:tellurite resistance protein
MGKTTPQPRRASKKALATQDAVYSTRANESILNNDGAKDVSEAIKNMQIPTHQATQRIRFASEQKLFDALFGDKLISQVAEKIRSSNQEEANRRRLLASALRITDHIIPSLKNMIELVKQITHLEGTHVETFIHNSPQQSASCMCFDNGDVFLLISSALYSSLSERELLFVVGHEFGHVAYRHHLLPARAILAQKDVCDADRALKLMAWSRRAEISADRVGLLCCQDLDAAAKAFIKLSSGLSEELVDFDLQGYVSQVTDLEAVSRTVRAAEDLYCTHPFNPIRIVALSRFWRSRTLCDLLGHAVADQSDQAVDARIQELLQFMDPEIATIENSSVVECLLWGGFLVAASDGRIDQVEVDAISSAVNSPITGEAVRAIQKSAQPLEFIRNKFRVAAEVCCRLPPTQRHAIIQQLVAVAKANLNVATEEKNALQEICIALKVNPAFPERILGQYADCVFAHMQ